ncbi:MAG: hypothetical protein ACOYVG_13290, partial [Bacteroidota bacterium]
MNFIYGESEINVSNSLNFNSIFLISAVRDNLITAIFNKVYNTSSQKILVFFKAGCHPSNKFNSAV